MFCFLFLGVGVKTGPNTADMWESNIVKPNSNIDEQGRIAKKIDDANTRTQKNKTRPKSNQCP